VAAVILFTEKFKVTQFTVFYAQKNALNLLSDIAYT